MPERALQAIAKQVTDPAIAEMLKAMLALHTQNGEKIDRLVERNTYMEGAIERLMHGFPQGDPEGHRRFHEVIIEREAFRNQLLKAALQKAVESGFLVGGGYVLYAIWIYFKEQVKA
jgi:hypothetical protein